MSEPAPEGALDRNRVRTLIMLALPAILIGVVSALVLFALDELSRLLQHLIWENLPHAVGADPDGGWWIFGTLTLTGLAVGLIVRFVPGHAGPDSAAVELGGSALPLGTVPGVAAAAVLGLAGGVSLGPENPIIAINTAILTVLIGRLFSRVPAQLVVGLTVAGTVGALFGTPVAAALLFTGLAGSMAGGGALFDRLFLPLAAAGAGAVTMTLLGGTLLTVGLPAMGSPDGWDVLAGFIIAPLAAGFALLGVGVFTRVHHTFHRLGNPVLFTTLGGALLGLLGVIGGPLTLFKGAEESAALLAQRGSESAWTLVFLAAVKLVALVIAAAAGFRGGRIFPAVFVGVAAGLAAVAFVPSVPVSLAVSAAVLGVVLAVARDGWMALFIAVLITGDVSVTAVLCLAVLPAWLVVTNAPHMLAAPDGGTASRPA
ncbi:ion channel protein [Arthrobacter jiangjiafuii]|uniref:Ion channel protein n=1 Tax=Arthrobacter jiangjiafuii TaxID=2817475 RepID=A0A975M2A7_9MICC|nr:ion channel protein [Arthrobacter jiangjiafuii]MBP3043064.1 ion channel protein [Arthrobacter jiangjiafuii]QWC08633.1 ion channel protein [Arthrobacter jiangjiafuii]